MADKAKKRQQSHFVLVHGNCEGAWIWYKVKPLLECAGHRVTVLDLAGSGIHPKPIQDAPTFYDYTEPLLKVLSSLPQNEKVMLVGHGLGGINLALAMENFPHKVSVAVFLTALMPDTLHRPSFVLEFVARMGRDVWSDTQLSTPEDPQNQLMTMLFGPKFMSSLLYQNSPIEDLELAKILVRPSSMYLHDLSKAKKFSEEKYGSVTRVYVVCDEDKAIPAQFQRWMIENNPVHGVMEINGADHMAMFSKPQQLCHCLSAIALKYGTNCLASVDVNSDEDNGGDKVPRSWADDVDNEKDKGITPSSRKVKNNSDGHVTYRARLSKRPKHRPARYL